MTIKKAWTITKKATAVLLILALTLTNNHQFSAESRHGLGNDFEHAVSYCTEELTELGGGIANFSSEIGFTPPLSVNDLLEFFYSGSFNYIENGDDGVLGFIMDSINEINLANSLDQLIDAVRDGDWFKSLSPDMQTALGGINGDIVGLVSLGFEIYDTINLMKEHITDIRLLGHENAHDVIGILGATYGTLGSALTTFLPGLGYLVAIPFNLGDVVPHQIEGVTGLMNAWQRTQLQSVFNAVASPGNSNNIARDLAEGLGLLDFYNELMRNLNEISLIEGHLLDYARLYDSIYRPQQGTSQGTSREEETRDAMAVLRRQFLDQIRDAINQLPDNDEDDEDAPGDPDDFDTSLVARDDPLVLDLTGDGLFTVGLGAGVFFDWNGNGFATSTGWISPSNGFLVLDRNGNGTIDSGREMFGDQTLLKDGITVAQNGFQALAEFDIFGHGVIDERSPVFHELRVWVDRSMNGRTDPGELYTLAELGIASISLGYIVPRSGNVLVRQGHYALETGERRYLGEWLFEGDPFRARDNIGAWISPEIARLPNIRNYGTMRTLHNAMALDPVLQAMVEEYANEPSTIVRMGMVRPIIFQWAQVNGINERARGSHVDARMLHTLEKLYARDWVHVTGTRNPGYMSGPRLTLLFGQLEEYVFRRLETQGILAGILPEPFCVDELAQNVESLLEADRNMGTMVLQSLDVYLYMSRPAEYIRFLGRFAGSFQSLMDFLIIGTDYDDDIEASQARDHVIYGMGGNDMIRITGNGNNTVLPSSGNDTITIAGRGDNIVHTGLGDNVIFGGLGRDTYVIGRSHGHNRITTSSGVGTSSVWGSNFFAVDRLVLTGGIRPDEVFFVRRGDDFLVHILESPHPHEAFPAFFDGATSTITFVNYFQEACRRITNITFDCGAVFDMGAALGLAQGQVFSIQLGSVITVSSPPMLPGTQENAFDKEKEDEEDSEEADKNGEKEDKDGEKEDKDGEEADKNGKEESNSGKEEESKEMENKKDKEPTETTARNSGAAMESPL